MPFQHQNNDFLPPLKMPLSPYIPTPKTCFSSASCFYSIKSRRRAPEIERKSVQISGTCGGGRSPPPASGSFRLPDLRSRFVVGYNVSDADYGSYGKVGGEKRHTLTVDEIPSHAHGQNLWTGGNGSWRSGGSNSYPEAVSWHDRTTPFGSTKSTGGGGGRPEPPPPLPPGPPSCGRSKREEMIDTLVLVVILAGSPVDSIGSPEPCAYVRYETKLREASRMAKTSANEHCAKWVEAYFSDLKTLTHTIDSVFRTALPQRERERMNRYLKKYGNGD